MIRETLARLRRRAEAWCVGRSPIPRAILLGYLVWVGIRCLQDPFATSLFSGITLGIHELGHLLLGWAGRFLAIAGGSLAQVAAPAAAAWLLCRQEDFFGVAVAAAWESFSLWNLATYIGDARAQELPLLGLGPDPIHDWNALLSMLGILTWDHALAAAARGLALLLWVSAIAFGGWLCVRMARAPRPETAGRSPDA